jgi:folate/biopterin transporter
MQHDKKDKDSNAIVFNNKKLKLFDIPVTPEVCAISIVYFIQGLFGICRLALNFYYKDTLHLSPADLTIISSISAIPWVIKPLYGFISDTFPLFGYKRRSYLLLSGLLSSFSWGIISYISMMINNGIILGDNITTSYIVFLVTLSSLGIAFGDVLIDAIVVGKSRDLKVAGSLQSICWSSSAIGGVISAYLSGYLLQNYGATFVFSATAIIPLAMTAAAVLIDEKKIDDCNDNSCILIDKTNNIEKVKIQIVSIWNTIQHKSILYPLLFLIIWNITPSAGSALFYFEVNELGFQPEFYGKLGLISSLSSFLGILIYNKNLKSIPLRTIFKWTCIIGTILGMSPLIMVTHLNRAIGIPDTLFAIIDDVVLSILGQITFMPIMVLAAQMCPPGVEAMLYATIMSANNLSTSVSKLLGGGFTHLMGITNNNFQNLPWLLFITNISGLIPLLFIHLVPDFKNDEKNE